MGIVPQAEDLECALDRRGHRSTPDPYRVAHEGGEVLTLVGDLTVLDHGQIVEQLE